MYLYINVTFCSEKKKLKSFRIDEATARPFDEMIEDFHIFEYQTLWFIFHLVLLLFTFK